MRIAFVSDIHGNLEALESVLRDAAKLGVDRVICAGDAVDPLPDSQNVLDRLTGIGAPIVRGNHEDYILKALQDPTDPIAYAVNWEPARIVARSIREDSIALLNGLPMTLRVPSEVAGDLLVCHASPESNLKGWRRSVSDEMALEIEAQPEPTILCGHWHMQETRRWRDKTLILNGSVGFPLDGKIEAQYAILEEANGSWQVEHREVAYDNEVTLSAFRDSGWAKAGGPMAWLLFDEVRTAHRRMVSFYQWVVANPQPISEARDLARAVKTYLQEVGSWTELRAYLNLTESGY